MNLQTDITAAWETNQSAAFKLADAVVLLRDNLTEKARGEALLLLDEARKLHANANSRIHEIQRQLGTSLDPTKCRTSTPSTSK